jgi:hypothetical protein
VEKTQVNTARSVGLSAGVFTDITAADRDWR